MSRLSFDGWFAADKTCECAATSQVAASAENGDDRGNAAQFQIDLVR
jgi:hypothetical protein